jgi:lipoprotein-anchoring transpeptidase ErfK/SrfK
LFALCLGASNLKTKSGDAMKALMLSKLAMVAVAAMVMAVQAMAQKAAKPQPAAQQNKAQRVIVVSLQDRKLALVENGQVKKVYSVAVGKPSTPSPTGSFAIARRVANPTYHHNGRTVLPGPSNPVGTRWMGLSTPGYGIHGTNEPNSIGKPVSHGCIRMARKDLEEFYELVSVGDEVELVGERNEQTALLFGDGETPVAAAEPVLMAMATPAEAPAAVTAQAPEVAGEQQAEQAMIAAR